MRSRKGCRSSARVSLTGILLTSTDAMGFWTRPTIVTSPMVMTFPFFWAAAGPAATSRANSVSEQAMVFMGPNQQR